VVPSIADVVRIKPRVYNAGRILEREGRESVSEGRVVMYERRMLAEGKSWVGWETVNNDG
jgi:hypothetical protein